MIQTAMFATEPRTDQRSSIHTALYNSYAQLLDEVARQIQNNHYSAHELYEIMIDKGYLKPTFFKEFLKFLRWAVREGYLDKSKIVSKTIKGVRIPNRFTKEQLLAYFRTVEDPRIAVASFIAFWSGLRIGDVIKLKVEDFDFEAETVKIVQSKRSKDRIAPFLRDGQKIVEKWIKYAGAIEYLFPSYNSHSMATIKMPHLSTRTLTNGFNEIIHKANLQRVDERYMAEHGKRKKFTFHTFRHTFCTYHLEHEVSAAFVARAAGHSDMRTTVNVYGHMASAKMIRAFRRSFEEGKGKSIPKKPASEPKKDARTDSLSPLAKLAEKFIAGEISDEEFRRKKSVLQEAGLV